MPIKGKGGITVGNVRKIAEPIAASLGLSIWDVRFVKEGAGWYLRIFIDKDGGVSLDDCVDFSHAIDGPLDDSDPIEQSYYLEVSSPGLERSLTQDAHFQAKLGEKVKVRLIRPREDKRDFNGILETYENGMLTIRLEDGSGLCIDKKEASSIKLDDFDDCDDFDDFGGTEE